MRLGRPAGESQLASAAEGRRPTSSTSGCAGASTKIDGCEIREGCSLSYQWPSKCLLSAPTILGNLVDICKVPAQKALDGATLVVFLAHVYASGEDKSAEPQMSFNYNRSGGECNDHDMLRCIVVYIIINSIDIYIAVFSTTDIQRLCIMTLH